MTDRELLKLAAKAAGISHPGGDHSIYNDGRLWDCERLRWWNPLTDDGDALRLAAELRMVITVGARNVEARRWTAGEMEPMYCQVVAQGSDPYAATRRAIVRAAAAIGETCNDFR